MIFRFLHLFLFLICVNNVVAPFLWSFINYIDFLKVECRGNECNLLLDIRASKSDGWNKILIRVKLGHTDKIDDGELAIYDVNENNQPLIFGNKNKFFGSIQNFGEYRSNRIGCNRNSCSFGMCIKRGRSQILKEYDEKSKHIATWIEWTPLISFNELEFGPRMTFKYNIKNGIKSRLEFVRKVYYWDKCDKTAFSNSDYYEKYIPYYQL